MVSADKGFVHSDAHSAFVSQKKNHFQVTVSAVGFNAPKYIRTDVSLTLIVTFKVSFFLPALNSSSIYPIYKVKKPYNLQGGYVEIRGFYVSLYGFKNESKNQLISINQSTVERQKYSLEAIRLGQFVLFSWCLENSIIQ